MSKTKIANCFLATCLGLTPAIAFAGKGEQEIPFPVGELFFELNDTDNDLGIHAMVDGEIWKRLRIEDPRDRRMLNVYVNGRLKRQGLTEIFFESAEPTFDELDPADFFNRFPEGIYDIEGILLDGQERENEVFLSHVIPAAPAGAMINNVEAAAGCDDEIPSVSPPITISWDPVSGSHASLGKNGAVEVRYYELVVQIEDTDFKSVALLPANITEWAVPPAFIDLADEFKFEILVRAESGNKSAMESCFALN